VKNCLFEGIVSRPIPGFILLAGERLKPLSDPFLKNNVYFTNSIILVPTHCTKFLQVWGMGRVVFHLTGFGPFREIVNNPSSELVKTLASTIPEGAPFVIGSTTTDINVSGIGTLQNLLQVREKYHESKQKGDITIFMHFGVGSRHEGFDLELVARNLANWEDEDPKQWAPNRQQVSIISW
jgi:hypothetical protein